jgi:plastocyanin
MLNLRAALVVLFLISSGGLHLVAQTNFEAVVRTAEGKPVPDAVLSLTPLDGQSAPVLAPSAVPAVKIIQRGQEYEPLVTAVRTGSPIAFPNLDTVQHHIYSVSKPKRFEIPLYDRGRSETVVFDQPGVVTLGCNIHDWMLAYVVVLDTAWFAVSDAEGRISLLAPPAGRYRLDLWHPRLAKAVTREIVVGPGVVPVTEFALVLRPDRRLRRQTGSGAAGSNY